MGNFIANGELQDISITSNIIIFGKVCKTTLNFYNRKLKHRADKIKEYWKDGFPLNSKIFKAILKAMKLLLLALTLSVSKTDT